MTSSLQGIIIALLMAFFVGILVGYSFMQRRWRQQSKALELSQRQLAEMEQAYESRLRDTTTQLRRDYEAEMATTIEHYQDQLSQKTVEMEQIYETRFRVLQQGDAPAVMQSAAVGATPGSEVEIPMPSRPFQPSLVSDDVEDLMASSDRAPSSGPDSLTQPELLHLKKQYEMRLKEAAQKLQKAYEKQLAHHAKQTRNDLHSEYEKLLAQKLAEFEDQLAAQKAELAAEYANRATDSPETGAMMVTPSQIMGTGDETTVALSAPGEVAGASANPAPEFDLEAELQARLQTATEQIRADYERQLAEQQTAQQAEFDQRLQAIDADYQQKTTEYQQKIDELSASSLTSESPDLEDDLFSDDLFDLDDTSPEKSNKRDDDDDFGPLDLSDISQLT